MENAITLYYRINLLKQGEVVFAALDDRFGGSSSGNRSRPAGDLSEKFPVVGIQRQKHVAARPVFEATGLRIRSMPIHDQRLKQS
jgi:hypothetical protein